MKLNLGSGNDIREGYVNCDYHNRLGADKVFDLNKFPYPFKNNSVDEIQLNGVLEHLDFPSKTITECHRILKKNRKLFIIVPYNETYGDIHKQNFLLDYFYFFAKKGLPSKIEKHKKESRRLNWDGYVKFSSVKLKLYFPKGLHIFNYLIEPFVNWLIKKSHLHYQHTFLKAIFPANEIRVVYVK
ncbi:MAG: methyltransferase domain-containing protein [Nanoarchaeota archaeon]|nr:methyltransferase domain-containing protein [Nanoarchaeota archaeon]